MTVVEVATEMNMIDTKSQWLFLISNPRKTNVTQLISYIKEGGNVAFATNNTIIDGTCSTEEECLYHELFKNFAMAISKLVREEEAIYGQISDEEWETIRLTKRERRDSMLEFIKVRYIKAICNKFHWFIFCSHAILGTFNRESSVQAVCQLEIWCDRNMGSSIRYDRK